MFIMHSNITEHQNNCMSVSVLEVENALKIIHISPLFEEAMRVAKTEKNKMMMMRYLTSCDSQ